MIFTLKTVTLRSNHWKCVSFRRHSATPHHINDNDRIVISWDFDWTQYQTKISKSITRTLLNIYHAQNLGIEHTIVDIPHSAFSVWVQRVPISSQLSRNFFSSRNSTKKRESHLLTPSHWIVQLQMQSILDCRYSIRCDDECVCM